MKFAVFASVLVFIGTALVEGVIDQSGSSSININFVQVGLPTPASPTPAPTYFNHPTPAPTSPTPYYDYPTPCPTVYLDTEMVMEIESTSGSGSMASIGVVGKPRATKGLIGVATATTRAEYDSTHSSVPPVGIIAGCVAGVIAVVAAAMVVKKRRATNDVETDFEASITPVSIKAETAYASAVRTPVPGGGHTDYSSYIETPVSTV